MSTTKPQSAISLFHSTGFRLLYLFVGRLSPPLPFSNFAPFLTAGTLYIFSTITPPMSHSRGRRPGPSIRFAPRAGVPRRCTYEISASLIFSNDFLAAFHSLLCATRRPVWWPMFLSHFFFSTLPENQYANGSTCRRLWHP